MIPRLEVWSLLKTFEERGCAHNWSIQRKIQGLEDYMKKRRNASQMFNLGNSCNMLCSMIKWKWTKCLSVFSYVVNSCTKLGTEFITHSRNQAGEPAEFLNGILAAVLKKVFFLKYFKGYFERLFAAGIIDGYMYIP